MSDLYFDVKKLFAFAESETKRIGTGIPEVDRLCRGPAPGEIFMVLGRSYAGKSLIGQNIIYHNAKIPSIFFSLEMPAMQALIRLYAMWSDTPSTDVQLAIEAGEPPVDMWDIVEAFPYHKIVDDSGLSVQELSDQVTQFEAEKGVRPEFVVVDYLELLGGAKKSGEGYIATEVQSTLLKDWAKQEEMRVFVLHQTNRNEKRWEPPTEDSARNAGYTEADFVIGLWNPHMDPRLDPVEKLRLQSTISVNILKNRPFFQNKARIDVPITPSLRVWREDTYERTRSSEQVVGERTEVPANDPY